MNEPKKWHEVYPYGTKEGDEEAKVFRALSRNAKFEYRSTGAIIKATGLSRERVEEIIDKYAEQANPPLIYPHPNQEDHWGYWERCGLPEKCDKSISGQDQSNRIDKHLVNTPNMVVAKGDNAVAANKVDSTSLSDVEAAFDALEEACLKKDRQLCADQGWVCDL